MAIQFKRRAAAALAGFVPRQGEPVLATDTGVLKVGDGATPWTGLPAVVTGVPGGVIDLDSVASKAQFNVKDYGAVGDGATDDTAAVNAAIAAYNTAGGGEILFPAGSYLVGSLTSIAAPGTIAGQGYGTIGSGNGTSTLRLKNATNGDMLTLAAKNITVRDIGLYGNKANQSATSRGIVLSSSAACNYFRFERVWVGGFRDDGVVLQGPGTSLEGMMRGLRLDLNGGYGLSVGTGAADCQATDSVFCQNTSGGAQINAGSFTFTACHVWGNTGPGIFMPSGAAGAMRVVGCYVETNGNTGIAPRGAGNQIVSSRIWKNSGRGIYAFSNTGLVVQGNSITANNTGGATGATGAGCNFDTCTASAVVGNYFAGEGQPQKYGYAETANTCNACVFSGNVSRAADHGTGNWLIGTGNPTATIPASPESVNVG